MNSDVDLIPGEYRALRQRKRHLWLALGVLAAMLVLASMLAMMLAGNAKKVERSNQDRRTQTALGVQQQEQLVILEERLAALEQEWLVLRGLRSGASAHDLFVLIDSALPAGEVWFDDWQFRRAGVLVPDTTSVASSGYFIVVPARRDTPDDQPWQVRTTMTIRGQARDHAALSRFVRGLYEQPHIQNVKLNRTTRLSVKEVMAVAFDLSIVLHSESVADG